MRPTTKSSRFAALAMGLVMAAGASSALAFTIENKDGSAGGLYAVPKFDLEEQARNFRTTSPEGAAGAKRDFDTPVGKGTLQFGVQQRPAGFGFGPSFGPVPGTRAGRADFDRMVTPENLR
jgi:hypothetical protein